MGCGGGYRDIFKMMDYMGHSERHRHGHDDHYRHDDTDEKLTLLKKIYAEGYIGDNEYLDYKEKVYARGVSFEELIDLKREQPQDKYSSINLNKTKSTSNLSGTQNQYRTKIKQVNESKQKVLDVQNKILTNISELKQEKKRMEEIAETMLKSNEEAAERYINNKLDIEGNIQSLERRNKELDAEVDKINRYLKDLESKSLELEALQLQEELSSFKMDD